MKRNQLKTLLKHIILEVQKNEMIVNKNFPPDVYGAVNVEEGRFDGGENTDFNNGDKVKLKPQWAGKEAKEIFTLSQWNGKRGWIGDKRGSGWYVNADQIVKVSDDSDDVYDDANEQTGTSAVAGYSTPFAFKKKKNENSNFENKLKSRLKEKTNPDGTYSDDMEDSIRMKHAEGLNEGVLTKLIRLAQDAKISIFSLKEKDIDKLFNQISTDPKIESIKNEIKNMVSKGYIKNINDIVKWIKTKHYSDLNEMTTSGAAGGQAGGTISIPAWGTKNKLGSPGAIAATKKMKGWTVAKSISTEGQ